MDEIGQLSILIGGVYDTALDPSLWVKVLEDAARFIGGSAAAVFSKDATKKASTYFINMASIQPTNACMSTNM